jgi:hypothetical protein
VSVLTQLSGFKRRWNESSVDVAVTHSRHFIVKVETKRNRQLNRMLTITFPLVPTGLQTSTIQRFRLKAEPVKD